jgi:polyisoprenoid-binding protein YceI
MKHGLATLPILWALVLPALAQPAATLLPAQSEITFTSTQMGVPVEGRFRRFHAAIAFDPRQPGSGSVTFTVDTGSATLGIAETDAELSKPNWFDSARFPQATFRSRTIRATGAGGFEASGTLAIKGRTQDLVVPVVVAQTGASATVTGGFTLKRLAFRIGEAEWSDTALVANDVAVHFRLTLTGLPPP